MIRLSHFLVASALAASSAAPPTSLAAAAAPSSHAFDYQLGVWRVHVARLMNPGASLARWTHYDGTHTVMPLLRGRANIGVLEIAGPQGSIEGLQLRLFDPQTQQWSLSFASGSDGELQAPSVGRFAGDRATFLGNEQIAGRSALVRTQTIVQDASAYRDVIAYSIDGGATWQPIWIASYVKVANDTASIASPAKIEHDFDFQVGNWRVQLARLAKRLSSSRTWRDYEGSLVVRRLWNGRANVGVLEGHSGDDCIERILLRTFDTRTNQWRDYAVDAANGSVLMPAAIGRFSHHRGELYDRETLAGRQIVVRYVFDQISLQSNRFVQSFSADGGKSWEPNLIVHLTRAASR